jgi:hypothetical protein
MSRRDGRVAEGARLESVYTGNRIGGSNPSLSAITSVILHLPRGDTQTDSNQWSSPCRDTPTSATLAGTTLIMR